MLDPVSAASVPKPFERRPKAFQRLVLAESVLMPFLGAAMSGCSRRTAGGRSGRVVIAVPDIPEMNLAAIHAR